MTATFAKSSEEDSPSGILRVTLVDGLREVALEFLLPFGVFVVASVDVAVLPACRLTPCDWNSSEDELSEVA